MNLSIRGFLRWLPSLVTYVLVVVALALAILWVIPARPNYYLVFPGDAQPVASLISVSGHHGAPTSGGLYDTYVNEFKATRLLYVLFGLLRSDVTIEPASAVSNGCPDSQYQQQLMAMMADSKIQAEAAALHVLRYRIQTSARGPEIEQISCGVPAESVLRAGDRILAVDHTPINGRQPNGRPYPCSPIDAGLGCNIFRQVQYLTELRAPGSVLHLTILRNGATKNVSVRTVHADALDNIIAGGGHAMIGIVMAMPLKFPVKVNINTGTVGGPSAGLAFALGIVQQLSHHDLTNGNKVAVTGTIALQPVSATQTRLTAVVGPIGGARQKALAAQAAGAKYFLVPAANYQDAISAHADLKVIPVATLNDALRILRSLPRPKNTGFTGSG